MPEAKLPSFPIELITPCGDCLHRVVCAIRPTLDPFAFRVEALEELDGALTVRAPVSLVVECTHFLSETGVALADAVTREVMPTITVEQPRRALDQVMAKLPEPAPKRQPGHHSAHPKEQAEKADRAARVMAALERHGGDRRAAAAELGMKVNAVAMVAKHARLRSEGGT